MSERRFEEVATGSGDCEFVPPPRLPETWGLSWERQMLAALAWQEATGEDDHPSRQQAAIRRECIHLQ